MLAALFLVVTMALLAIPGSANFIGEFYILNGVLQTKVVYAVIASVAIALAAYYGLRLFQLAMHNRKRDDAASKEIGLREGAIVGALVACIVALALYPGLVLERSDSSVKDTVGAVQERSGEAVARR